MLLWVVQFLIYLNIFRYSCLEKAASKENEIKDNFRSGTNNTPDVSADISVEKYEPTESLKLPVGKPIGKL